MEVRIYSCPLQTGWVYCDVRAPAANLHTVHVDALQAYHQCRHLDQPGVKFQVDVAGFSLKSLREKSR
jgi:hypothetical protein